MGPVVEVPLEVVEGAPILVSKIVDGVEVAMLGVALVVVAFSALCRLLVVPPLKLAVMMAMCTLLERPLLKVAF